MQWRSLQGFTLIELLVVIAIIGILSTIVLVSLSTTRTSSADTSIKANLAEIRAQAEIYAAEHYDSYGLFNGGAVPPLNSNSSCLTQSSGNMFADPTIKQAMTNARVSGNNVMTCFIAIDGKSWAVAIALKSNAANAWCVDSNGVSVLLTPSIDPPGGTSKALSGSTHLCQ